MGDWITLRPGGESEEDLSEAQWRAICAMAQGASVKAAAEEAGVNRGTLHRWMNDPRFGAALNRSKADRRAEIRGELQALASGAVKTLGEVLEALPRNSPLRVKVALGILKAVGVDQPEEIGPVSPERLRKEWGRRDRAEPREDGEPGAAE